MGSVFIWGNSAGVCVVHFFRLAVWRTNTIGIAMEKKKKKPSAQRPAQADRDAIRSLLKEIQYEGLDGPSARILVETISTSEAAGEHLAWLAAYDLDPEISAAAFIVMISTLKEGSVPAATQERIGRRAAPILRKALESPGVPDERKFGIAPLHALCSGGPVGEDYRRFFKDFDGVTGRLMTEATSDLSDDPCSVEHMLSGMDALLDEDSAPDERCRAVAAVASEVLETKPAAAAAILSANLVLAWQEGVRGDAIDAGLAMIEQARCPEAAWFLSEMGRWQGLDDLGKRAERAATKMKLRGTQPGHKLARDFSHASVSAPDGTGSRQVNLFWRTPEGGMDALILLLNDRVGIKDAQCIFDEGADVEEMLQVEANELPLAFCTLELAREMVADALVLHETQGTPLPGGLFVYRPYLGEAPIVPQPRKPDLRAYRLDDLERTPELFEDSEQLADLPPYGFFTFASDEAYEFVANAMPKRSRRLPKKTLDKFLREVAVQEKDVLLTRMAATLEVEILTGRAIEDHNQIAAATLIGLGENVLPFHEVPYICALGMTSVEMIIENIRLGFRNQAEADEAALEMDEEFDMPFDDGDFPF